MLFSEDSERELKVLLVCTANVCRSPMAAGLFKREAARQSKNVRVASAGLLPAGEPAHPFVVDILAGHGVDASRRRSRQIDASLVEHADVILTMTASHARDLVGQYPSALRRTFMLRYFGQLTSRRPVGESVAEWVAAAADSADGRRFLEDSEGLDIPDPITEPKAAFKELESELKDLATWIVYCAGPLSCADDVVDSSNR